MSLFKTSLLRPCLCPIMLDLPSDNVIYLAVGLQEATLRKRPGCLFPQHVRLSEVFLGFCHGLIDAAVYSFTVPHLHFLPSTWDLVSLAKVYRIKVKELSWTLKGWI